MTTTQHSAHTLTADLTDDQRAAAVARSAKRCRFGHIHFWTFEFDLNAGKNTGWVYCGNCTAREWDGE
jgi:hypothetical protein